MTHRLPHIIVYQPAHGEPIALTDPQGQIILNRTGQAFIDNLVQDLNIHLFGDAVRLTNYNVSDLLGINVTSITSVTNPSGPARFNFTPGPKLYVEQQISVSGYTTNIDYNGTGVVSVTGTGFFELEGVAFGTNEAGGQIDAKPSAAPATVNNRGALLHVLDEAGGEITAFSDSITWRRETDRAIIS
jgi:hypothetical protein